MRIAIVADSRLSKLCGLDASCAWGEARTMLPGDDALAHFSPDAVIALGSTPLPEIATAHRVRWHAGAVESAAEPERVVATSGSGLWRRAPLPVRDDVFELEAAPEGAAVLVIGSAQESALVLEQLEGRRLSVVRRERLARRDLEDVGVVVLAGEPDRPLMAEAMAVVAARRVLIAPHPKPAFGLLAGVDHLAYGDAIGAAAYADIATTFPESLEAVRGLGRIAARPHRASDLYARVAVDLTLEARERSSEFLGDHRSLAVEDPDPETEGSRHDRSGYQ